MKVVGSCRGEREEVTSNADQENEARGTKTEDTKAEKYKEYGREAVATN